MRSILIFLLTAIIAAPAFANAQPFDQWLAGIRAEAARQGISQTTIDAALSGIQPIQRVIELDRRQPEGRLTFAQYRTNVVNRQRIEQGRRLMREHESLLRRVEQEYGVAPQYVVALWGIETNYGGNTGGFSVINALATLAWEGRRADFFRGELLHAMKIIDAGHIKAPEMKGSWAGAMGQNQFMPSSFHAFAVDGNGDGKRDIWNSLPDVFASTANYLSKSGWEQGLRWGRQVTLPPSFSESMTGLGVKKSLAQWQREGVRTADGLSLPDTEGLEASVVIPDGLAGPAFLVYDNYRVVMKWNKSTYFATSVGLLADQIARQAP